MKRPGLRLRPGAWPMALAMLLCSLLAVAGARAEVRVDTDDAIYDDLFRTLKVQVEGRFMDPPVITLGGDRRIVISFDEMTDDVSQLQYRLIHCNADWQPSALVESEYLDGFNIADIDDVGFSANTFVHYVNYRIVIPSESMRPVVSGNYLVQVFDRYEPETTLLQARFSVSEDAVSVTGDASGRTDRGLNTTWQQLEVRLSTGDFDISNPYNDLTLTVSQNGVPETLRVLPPPSRVEGKRIVWQHTPSLIFPAGNEYRRFETVRVNNPNLHVDSMRYVDDHYHAWLIPDADRSERLYVYDRTQHGRFLVRESSATDSSLGADYLTVHFTLDFPQLTNGSIYVDGEFTRHLRDESTRMDYDPDDGVYRLAMPLKQGSYNYRYVCVPDSDPTIADPGPVEGDFFETGNEYDVRVYYRPPGARADRLISHGVVTTQ